MMVRRKVAGERGGRLTNHALLVWGPLLFLTKVFLLALTDTGVETSRESVGSVVVVERTNCGPWDVYPRRPVVTTERALFTSCACENLRLKFGFCMNARDDDGLCARFLRAID